MSFVDVIFFRPFVFYLFVGLFHGKDIRFGNNISHSEMKTSRTWLPNVQYKRVWSDALNDWVKFQFTTAGLKAVDNRGGIDNYLLELDESVVSDSRYVLKMRNKVAAILFHQGKLKRSFSHKLGYHRCPPPLQFPDKLDAVELAAYTDAAVKV